MQVHAHWHTKPLAPLHQVARLPGHADADRVREDDLSCSCRDAALCERDHRLRSTFPSKGQPNETLIETLTGSSVVDPLQLRDGLVDGAVRVAAVELVRRSEREMDGVKAEETSRS